jgi:hypothetical protein
MNQAILAARLISVVIGAITDRADALADRDRAPAGRGRAAGGAGQDGGGGVNEYDDYVRPPNPWRMYVAVGFGSSGRVHGHLYGGARIRVPSKLPPNAGRTYNLGYKFNSLCWRKN